MRTTLLTAILLGLLATCSRSHGEEAEKKKSKQELPALEFAVLDLRGATHELRQNDQRKVRALVFLSTECPVSNSYTQTLNALHKKLAEEKAELLGIVSDSTITRAAAANHFREFKADFPVLFDASGQLAAALQPTHVPQAFVLDDAGRVVYSGAVDDTWNRVGQRRDQPQRRYLEDAIQSTLAGEAVKIKRTTPVGCLFETLPKGETDAKVTFNRDIAPIIYARCLNCHREGQVAPFPLATYEHVAKRADWIVSVTADRIMPPWVPKPGNHKFVGERWLTERELDLLSNWADTGRARGDAADLPPVPKFAEGWRLGEPDMVLKMPEPFTVYADGPDIFQNFVIPVDIPQDRMVAAVEFHPGNKRVVHHCVLFLDTSGAARRLDAATDEPGYANFGGPGFLPSGALGGWSVGNTARKLPGGMGRYLKKGSDLVMQIHYHPTGKEEVDQSEVGLYFIDKPVKEVLKQPAKLVGSIWMANYEMDIPPGETNYRRTTSYTLPKDVIMVGVVPHMHLLGKSMKVTATLPGDDPKGQVKTLIDIDNWNYNWQDEYYYQQPFKLPAGTRLTVDAVYDNSKDNPANPNAPPKRVTWGDETDDEMLYCFFLISSEKTEDLIHVIFDNLRHDGRQPRAKTK